MRASITPFSVALLVSVSAIAALGAASGINAQVAPTEDDGWNGPEVLDLISRARLRRLQPLHDSTLSGYTARADGRILFFVEREDGGEPFPLRIDQVSLDLYWTAPDRVRQVVRAHRNKELFPLLKDFSYYLDRLSVIQNGFGDEIRVGEGQDVSAVPHPLAPASERVYDFRLADQIRLLVGGVEDAVVVREVQVRPQDHQLPGIVGTILIDETTSSLVRLNFTFTPASYVDPRNDGIVVSLENALWEGRFWLPYRQVVRVRREIPEFDLPIGTVIQAELEVLDYSFVPPPPNEAPRRPGLQIVFPADGVGDTTRFERGLAEELAASGLITGDWAKLETEAIGLLREQVVSGLPRWRLGGEGSESFVRANRVEGLFTGLGLVWRLPENARIGVRGGWASGSNSVAGGISVDSHSLKSNATWSLNLSWDEPWDPEIGADAPALLNSAAVLLSGSDWTDPVPVRGGSLVWRPVTAPMLELEVLWEEHRSRTMNWDQSPIGHATLRPLVPAISGRRTAIRGSLGFNGRVASTRTHLHLDAEGGSFGGRGYLRTRGALSASFDNPITGWAMSARLRGGAIGGDPPTQLLWFIGGRGTLPGYGFRSSVGRAFALAETEVTRAVIPTWVDLRVSVGGGRTSGGQSPDLSTVGIHPTAGWKAFVGAGIGLLGGAIRVHHFQGLNDGRGEWVISFDPRWAGL